MNRQPAGVPTGGQFASDVRGRAGIALPATAVELGGVFWEPLSDGIASGVICRAHGVELHATQDPHRSEQYRWQARDAATGTSYGDGTAPTLEAAQLRAVAAWTGEQIRTCTGCQREYLSDDESGLNADGDGEARCRACGEAEVAYWQGQYTAGRLGRAEGATRHRERDHADGAHTGKPDPGCEHCDTAVFPDHTGARTA